MTAKEMFEELGYKVVENLSGIYVYNNNVLLMIFTDIYYSTECEFTINKELHKAIIKQIKELGWESDK